MGAPIIWNGNNAKLLKPNLDFGECLVKSGTFFEDGSEPEDTPADVTDFLFANASTKAFKATVSVLVDATTDLQAVFELHGVQKAASWELSSSYVGDETNINFSITAAGQIQYTSLVGGETGWADTTIKWIALALDI